MAHQMDELAKALASGISRRDALRLISGSLVGVVLSAMGIEQASAAKGRNSDCVEFCKQIYPPGAARGQCISEAAQGRGPCYDCGGSIYRMCSPDPYDLSRGVCCAPGQACRNGMCTPVQAGIAICFPAGRTCSSGEVCCADGCCGPIRECVDGRCVCPANIETCGDGCCPAGYICTLDETGAGICKPGPRVCRQTYCPRPVSPGCC